MDLRAFQPFGLSHWFAMIMTVLAAAGLIRLHRSAASRKAKRRANVCLATVLLLAVAADPVLTAWRYRSQPELAVGSLFDYMGPGKWYLLTLQAVAFSLYALLLLPFRKNRQAALPDQLSPASGTIPISQ